MIAQALSDVTKFMHSVDSKSTKFGPVTNTGMQKDLRGSNGSTGKDDFALSSNGSTGAYDRRSTGFIVISYMEERTFGCSNFNRSEVLVAGATGGKDPGDSCIDQDGEVRSLPHGRSEISL